MVFSVVVCRRIFPVSFSCMYDAVGTYSSPLGVLKLAAFGDRLAGLWFEDQRYAPVLQAILCDCAVLETTRRWLDAYFEGRKPGALPPLYMEGTPFRKEIWRLLLQIPYGEVCTYQSLAAAWGRKQGIPFCSARAVGNAVGHNPISILVPCHRVVGSDGSLVGYAGGLERKRYLLALEQVRFANGRILQEKPSWQERQLFPQLFPENL